LKITDISKHGDSVVVTTLDKHGMKMHGWRPTRVTFSDTGHFMLDVEDAKMCPRKRSSQKIFCVRNLDEFRLEVLSTDGNAVTFAIESSMGWLTPLFLDDLVNSGPYISTVLVTGAMLPLPWLIALADPRPAAMSYAALAVTGAIILSAVITLLLKVRTRSHQKTAMQVRLKDFSKFLAKKNPNPTRCDKGPGRALTIGQFLELLSFFCDFIRDRNAYYLDPNIIRPLTKPFQIGRSLRAQTCGLLCEPLLGHLHCTFCRNIGKTCQEYVHGAFRRNF
jgi:hypothetical protein